MKHYHIGFLALFCIGCQAKVEKKTHSMNINEAWIDIKTPEVEKVPKEMTIHGDTRIDNYYWLNERENQKVLAYLAAENKYLDTVLSSTKKLQEELFDEMKARIKEDDESVPYFENGYFYYTRFEKGKEYPIYCRKKENLKASEEVMLNVNEMAAGHSYYQVASLDISPDNKLAAFGVDTVSRRKYTLYIKNLETGEILPDQVPETDGSAVWAADNKTIFYSRKNPVTLREERIFKHKLGQPASTDKEVYYEKDETFDVGVHKTKSQKYIVISSGSTLSDEYRILDASQPDGAFKVFQPRQKDMLYAIDHKDDKFYIVTNWDAINFRMMECPLDKTTRDNWKETIPHRPDVLLQSFELFKDYMVISERKNGLTQLRVIDNNKKEHYLDFGEAAYVAYPSVNPEFNTKILRYSYSSMTTPASTYDYDMEAEKKELKKRQEVLGGYNPAEYVTERVYAIARDSVKVPISIVYKKGFEKNGKMPLLLYGYGSYGASMEPSFSSTRLSLLNRGFAYAIAHIRGGEEMGRQWYEDGKMFKKKNTFNDFIDCAEYLLKNNYTSKQHLYAMGGSAGGLLMGAVVNMRPDLWHGVIAAVPFVDVVTTMLDETIPLTTGEFDEWGNPKNKDSYEYMKSYSPYDNVEKKDYPNMLVTTGLHDSQVQYFEPAKWVAKLRELKTDKNVLLMYTNMEAGHGGASGRFKALKDVARQYGFLLFLEGIEK